MARDSERRSKTVRARVRQLVLTLRCGTLRADDDVRTAGERVARAMEADEWPDRQDLALLVLWMLEERHRNVAWAEDLVAPERISEADGLRNRLRAPGARLTRQSTGPVLELGRGAARFDTGGV